MTTRWAPWLPPRLQGGTRAWAGRALAALLAMWATGCLSQWALGNWSPWLLAPMGASAVLLFAVPASPLAQPWPFFVGNLLSALVGIALAQQLGTGAFAAALAVGGSIFLMAVTRSLHPPGGAVALSCVLGGPVIHQLGWQFLWHPLLPNLLLMLLSALLLNRVAGTPYPHGVASAPNPHQTRDPLPRQRTAWMAQDVHQALDAYGEALDIDEADLLQLTQQALALAATRSLAGVRCGDVMARDVVTVTPETPVGEAWARLRQHRVKSLPVVDAQRQLLGVVSLPLIHAQLSPHSQHAIDWQAPVRSCMLSPPLSVHEDASLAALVTLFTDAGLHHLPVLDASGRVSGMISQSDLLSCVLSLLPIDAAEAAVAS